MTAVPKYPCARCGKKYAAEQMIYSRHTRKRYCADLYACAKNGIRKPKYTKAMA